MSQNQSGAMPRYTIEIDEEGYPLFEGLRWDDPTLLKELFATLRRADTNDLRSTLLTECEGELCYVNAFSAPLVAQSVEQVNEAGATWNFLGEQSYRVLHKDLLQDPWGRLHTWIGDQKLQAHMRTKAQADFLNKLSIEIHPKTFRSTADNVSDTTFWKQCYLDGRDGWEMRSATPVLAQHFKEIAQKFMSEGKILVPGCGRGHDAKFLATQKLSVTALDFSIEGLKDARELYPNTEGLEFVQADLFDYLNAHKGQFDGIFEHTIFCAIDPERREEFISKTFAALKPGGLWFGVFFMRPGPGGPPFGLTQWELRELVEPYFDIFDWKISPYSLGPRRNQELWAVFRKRA